VVFVPISIATHKIPASEAAVLFFAGLAWVIGLYFFARLLLLMGFKRYEAYGG
jgi:ABC-type uncharacterized transport system permease subunit